MDTENGDGGGSFVEYLLEHKLRALVILIIFAPTLKLML